MCIKSVHKHQYLPVTFICNNNNDDEDFVFMRLIFLIMSIMLLCQYLIMPDDQKQITHQRYEQSVIHFCRYVILTKKREKIEKEKNDQTVTQTYFP